jgi:hypothetical protein
MPGELRWFATVRGGEEIERPNADEFEHDGETITPLSRTFIPSSVRDNKYLMRTNYVAQLQSLPEPLRSQLLYGDMQAGVKDDVWQLIPTKWAQAAMDRWKPDGHHGEPMDALGADIAYGGADRTVLAPRHRHWWAPIICYDGHETPSGAAAAMKIWETIAPSNPNALVNIDSIGYGAAAFEACAQKGLRVCGINFGAGTKARDTTGMLTFRNLRAYAYWSFRELLDPANGYNAALPPDPELLQELCSPKWSGAGGVVLIEAKDEIKKRLRRSPDKADAVVLSSLMASGE